MIKTGYKSAVKKFEEAITAGKIDEAKVLFSEATKKIDQACTKKTREQNKKKWLKLHFLRHSCI